MYSIRPQTANDLPPHYRSYLAAPQSRTDSLTAWTPFAKRVRAQADLGIFERIKKNISSQTTSTGNY